MTESGEIIAFVRAQLDEDEQVALAATAGPWRHDPTKHWRKPGTSWFEEAVFAGSMGADATCVAGTGETDDSQSTADAAHIARHDPAWALAEVDAKRQLLDEYEAALEPDEEDANDPQWWGYRSGLEYAVRLLTQPHAARDGYRPEWAPNDGPRPT